MKNDTLLNRFWTIAGSDCSGGAGIQADLKTGQALDTDCATAITALTAQDDTGVRQTNAVDSDTVLQQISALHPAPAAVKTGMLCNAEIVATVARSLNDLDTYVVCDPVIRSSNGVALLDDNGVAAMQKHLFPRCNLITPNIPEAEQLTGHTIRTADDIQQAAEHLHQMGPEAVLIKGGHNTGPVCQDFYLDATQHCWINSVRQDTLPVHGTGCVLSAAIAATIAQGHLPLDAIVYARAYINRSIRTALPRGKTAVIRHDGPPKDPIDLPWITAQADQDRFAQPFPSCGEQPIGLYPLVDSLDQVRALTALNVPTLQLRIKETDAATVENTVREAIQLAANSQTRLFINDYWQLAIQHEAYGVHLGQEDLAAADLEAIQRAGLRLGTSTHGYSELARINTWRPSYVAMGTVFPSPSKPGLTRHLGLTTLASMVRLAEMPAVAIGGILLNNANSVAATGVSGIAAISAIRNARNLPEQVDMWRKLFEK